MKLADDAYSHCTAVGYMTLAEYFFKYILRNELSMVSVLLFISFLYLATLGLSCGMQDLFFFFNCSMGYLVP